MNAVASKPTNRPDSPRALDEAAAALGSGIAGRAADTEADRCVAKRSIDEMLDAGLFGVVGARSHGGLELGIEALVRASIRIGAACGSTGWVYGVLAGHSIMINLFPEKAQAEVAANARALIATVFRLGGEVVPVEGGYQLTNGIGRFCSGVDHASWILIGNQVIREGQPPEQRFFLLPRSEVEVIDDWHTMGMRGTGSKSIRIAEAFIPEHRTARIAEMLNGTAPGAKLHANPLYKMSFYDVTPFSVVGPPLGMALGAIRNFETALKKGLATAGTAPDTDARLLRLARASAEVDAAIALVLADAREIDSATSPAQFTLADRKRWPRNWTWAVQTARNAVNSLYEVSGGTSIYDQSPIQRIWRDINSAAQHFVLTQDNAALDYARAIAGLETATFVARKPTQI